MGAGGALESLQVMRLQQPHRLLFRCVSYQSRDGAGSLKHMEIRNE